jgi:hypothetical protein
MKRHPKTFVELGRAGDILNIFPLAKREFEKTGIKPRIMIAAQFADLLEGISYATPLVWPGIFDDICPALWTAQQDPGEVVVCQIYGHGWIPPHLCTSFLRESWALAGADIPWGSVPLVIDRRNARRERAVVRDLIGDSRKKIVLVSARGFSAPFPGADIALASLLEVQLGPKFKVVDLSHFRAPRMFDLLGIFDRAHCLLSIDTGTKHLAPASDVPVISLVDWERWPASSWRPKEVARFIYKEFPARSLDIVDAARRAKDPDFGPRIVHVWSAPSRDRMDENTLRRTAVARQSWRQEYKMTGRWIPAPFKRHLANRDSRSVGDSRSVPFIRDMIDQAIQSARDGSDIIALTNADVCFTPGITGWILEAVPRQGAAFANRFDFPRIDRLCVSEADVLTSGIRFHGTDAVFFTVDWWALHGGEFPDMLLGREHWDEVFRQLIKRYNGVELEAAIYHEKHGAFWDSEQGKSVNLGNLYNKNLINEWFARTGYRPGDAIWRRSVSGNY